MPFTRRLFLQTPLALAQVEAQTQTQRPNILWIMVDQLRFDCLGANGNTLIRTPNIDKLAARSANFQQAFVQSPVCVPSRASYFTGRYPHSHKNRVNYTPLDSREILAQQIFHDAGYQTGVVGKLHYYPPTAAHARSLKWDQVQLDDGVGSTDKFSDYVAWRKTRDPKANLHYNTTAPIPNKNPFRGAIAKEFTPTAWTGAQTRRMLGDFLTSPKPFFLYSSFFKPHSPHTVPEPYDTMYDSVDIPLPAPITLEQIQQLPLPVQKQILRGRPQYAMDRTRLEWIYRSYYSAVTMLDDEIGRILDQLAASPRAANTVIVFTTDHGDQLLEHGLEGKNLFFEASVRVPFLISWPGHVETGKRTQLAEMVDLLPTLLELAGLPPRKNIHGRSLFTAPKREFAFAENIIPEVITGGSLNMEFKPGAGIAGIRHPDAKMLRTSRYKFNYYPGNGGELYDLASDPHEARNLYAAQPKIVQEMKDRLLDFLITADENDQIEERWRV